MIQVCSRCGTRWNVRDRQRGSCPRCQGALLAPSAAPEPQWSAEHTGASQRGASQPSRRLPPGYRWIAVRPGAAPPARRAARPLGPTPRYSTIPRWGLQDLAGPAASAEAVEVPPKPTRMARAILLITLLAFGLAVVTHVIDYGLLLVNRSTLLNPIVAGVATWAAVTASVLAVFALVATFIVLTNWLIARRAAVYARLGTTDPRPVWQLRLGCLLPLANLFWAPVFVLELAGVEGRLTWLRTRIVVWWCGWWVSVLLSAFAFATSFTQDAQGIADNTVATTIAYLAGLATLLLTLKTYRGFEHTAVDKPVKRWVIVPDEADQSPARVESEREDPAA